MLQLAKIGRLIALGCLGTILTSFPVLSAERITFILPPFSRTLEISSLENFVETGRIDANLRQYLGNTTPEQQKEFRQALTTSKEINPVLISRFFNTTMGEDILNLLGGLITIQGDINGKFALRSALIKSAFEPGGVTILNLLRNLPTNMQIDVTRVQRLARAIDIVLKATTVFTEKVAQLSLEEAKKAGEINFTAMTDPRQPGPQQVEQMRLDLTDSRRQRELYLIIVKPKGQLTQKTPVIVFSHGLASRPEDFVRQAEHWASYGYLVAIPQHPGSDTLQVQNLLAGLSRMVFDTKEFVNRPLDISFVIDELQRRNAGEFQGQLDLDNVGVGGHSFGGYTALAVGGATIDFENLQRDCQRRLAFLNVSLLLQCRALDLPREEYNFRDRRIKAIFAVNPFNWSIFGAKGLAKIEIPTFVAAGTYDPATPAIFEQVRSFPLLNTENKYLALIEGQAHVDFSVLDAGINEAIESIADLTLPAPYVIDSYAHSLSLAFFEVYIRKNPSYKPFLQAAYSQYLSQGQEFRCFLITRASSAVLEQLIEDFIAQNIR